jgi:hypothetical protein
VILKVGRGSNIKHLPLAFTEHGTIMVATVLNSPRAAAARLWSLHRRAPEVKAAAIAATSGNDLAFQRTS